MKLLIYRPCSYGTMRPETCMWLDNFYAKLALAQVHAKEVVVEVDSELEISARCITQGRNKAVVKFLEGDYDYLLMIDPDMIPDFYVGKYDFARPFWETSIETFQKVPNTGVIGAPAVAARPERFCNVRKWIGGANSRMLTPREVLYHTTNPQFEHVAAIGTGLMLINRDTLEKMAVPEHMPWFEDKFNDNGTKLVFGQDIWFCLKCVKIEKLVWANWYSFAAHHKSEWLGCPGLESTAKNWTNSEWQMSDEALNQLVEVVKEKQPKKILEIGPGKSTWVLWKMRGPEGFDILVDDNMYSRIWYEDSEIEGFDLDGVQFVPNPFTMLEGFEPSHGVYDLIILDGPAGTELRSQFKDFIKSHSDKNTTIVIDDTHRENEKNLRDAVYNGYHRLVEVSDKNSVRQTSFLISAKEE